MIAPSQPDVLVIGGGLVGASIAYGLARLGQRVTLLDEGDVAYRASRGNFGLVWVQGKGSALPPYAPWAYQAGLSWPSLARELLKDAEIDVELRQTGGVHLCLTEDELSGRAAILGRLKHEAAPRPYEFEILERAGLENLLPGVGPDVVGASFMACDGHANPLKLLRALHRAFIRSGGSYLPGAPATRIVRRSFGARVETNIGAVEAPKVVLAAGLGNIGLARQVGTEIPIKPMRGQLLVTERVQPLFSLAMEQVRQTEEGTLLLGGSWEDVGYDTGTTVDVTGEIAQRAVRYFPMLRNVQVVRSWGSLRILSPDMSPIYQELPGSDGIFLITCHSGVSLAPNHVDQVAGWIAAGSIPSSAAAFSLSRFDSPRAEAAA